MTQSELDDTRWQLEEADNHTLEQFCKATQSDLKVEEQRSRVEAYILGRFDNAARVLLGHVAELTDIDLYKEALKDWNDICLPDLERDFRYPKITKAILRSIERTFGSIEGHITGSVDRGKLAARLAHWKQKAIRRARFIHDALLQIQSKRREGMNVASCLSEAYDLYPSGIDVVTEVFLTESIPSMVFRAAVGHKWLPYPPIRSTGRRVVGNFHQGWRTPSRYELVPQNELTETFGGYKVPNGYRAWFTRNLQSRIEYWRSAAKRPAATFGGRQPEPAGDSVPKPDKTAPAPPDNGADGSIERTQTVSDIRVALDKGDRKLAVSLRRKMDTCSIKALRAEAFQSHRAAEKTMVTAFNRWQATRPDTPAWAGPLIVARLLR